tara:strand:+ start:781 stop:1254 length:474 start_codon:yes stop_codon:yes gene_type:complete
MKFKIVKDESLLRQKCASAVNLEDAIVLGKDMLAFLEEHTSGVGLAANQVGINIRVCVVNVDKPLILVNPIILNKFKKISFQEGCLSFPGDSIVTERYGNIQVKADNHPQPLYFSEDNILETVCVQHEIDHLDGILMHDRKIDLDKDDEPSYDNGIF